MMSLLSVTVKKARYVGAQASQFNTYVTLKLQNVKSTTVTVKGATPCWEQDFLFETNDLNTGLLIEVWSKGMIWDRAMGYHWLPLQTVQYSNEEGSGQWLSLEAELVMRDGEVVGTKNPTGHSLLVDCRFELPFDPENIEASDLQRKLEMLNNIMDQEARMEQARRQMQYFGHSGYSEDSDYTSDLNYPVGQHANSSASQFRSAAHQMHTPQRSLETSRENSYERDDGVGHHHHLPTPTTHQHHLSPGTHRRHHQRYSPGNEDFSYNNSNTGHNPRQYQDNSDFDPLFYNSRPRNKPDYSSRRRRYEWDNEESQETWVSCETSFYNQSVDSMDGYSVESQYYNNQPKSKARRPSLERQNTLYDDSAYYGDSIYYPNENITQVNCVDISSQSFNQNQSCDVYYDSLSYPFQEDRYGQDEEDRQWDSGGYAIPPPKTNSKKLPQIPVVQNYTNKRRSSNPCLDNCYDEPYRSTPTFRRKMPQIPTKRSASRQSSFDEYRSHRGASLPPTPTKAPKMLPRINTQKAFDSLPPTPGRQLPKPNLRGAKAKRGNLMKRTSSAEYNDADYEYYMRPGAISAKEMYNEDYNYAYQSIDNLPAQPEDVDVNEVHGYSDRTSEVVSTMNAKNDEYYYNAREEYYNEVPDRKNKMINRNEGNLLLQQNTDSLESRDDELKDSFETAISSIASSQNQTIKTAESITTNANTTSSSNNSSILPSTQYQRDQIKPTPEAIVPTSQPPPIQTYKPPTRALLKQQESVDLNQAPLVNSYSQDEYHDAYLEPQESVESYIEEDTDVNSKAINHDSPSSVIHVEGGYGDEESLRRGSSQITVVDPYHHDYAGRRPSVINTSNLNRRTSGETYPIPDETYSRKPSIVEPPQHEESTNEQQFNQQDLLDDEFPEKKSVSFEEEEEKPRRKVTAKQRWMWAYNKIIMQLNVSEQQQLLSFLIDR